MAKRKIPAVCRIRGKTEAQRRACHKALTGSSKVPKRGTGRGRGLRAYRKRKR